jgi:hypothetical protein
MHDAHQLEPAIGPLQNVLGYLTEIIRLDGRVVERLPDHQLADGHRFVFHQHELENLPGIAHNTFDADGPVWLAIEPLSATEPPVIDSDLTIWVELSSDPDQRPLVRQSVLVTVDGPEKDRLIAAGHARAEDCSHAIAHDASSGIWSVRLRMEQRPDLVERIDRYIAGPWTTWATAERPCRRTIAIHRRLKEMARVAGVGGSDRSCEIVWGVGVSRWRHNGHNLDLPLLERLVEIEILESPDAEIRIRPRMVGARVNLKAFETLAPGAVQLARDSAERLLEAIERGGEVSPFLSASFEPILSAISTQLDPQGSYRASVPEAAFPLPEAGEQLVVSDRWVIFARPRSDGLVLRDIERLKQAIEHAPKSECCLSSVAEVLAPAADHDDKAGMRRQLSGVLGQTIDVTPAPQVVAADQGDLFFPLPAGYDQVDMVRQLERSDGLMVQGPRGGDRTAAIANIVCHHLALGLRVLVVSRNETALALLSEKLPRAVRDLTVNLTGSDKDVLKHAEAVVGRLQSIVDTMNPRDQADQISRLERDIIATRQEIARIDDEVAEIASSNLRQSTGFADLPFDVVKALADRDAYAWFTDRPTRFLTAADPLVAAVETARGARLRLGGELKYIEDKPPEIATLPEAATLMRLHEDLRRTAEPAPGESRDGRLARHAVAALGLEGADKLAGDLDALVAVHRVIADEKWLAALSPLGTQAGEASADTGMVVDFARDASAQLSRRAGFLTRPVEAPADAFANQELIEVVNRLAAGEKVFTTFARAARALKPVIDTIKVAGFAPGTAADWTHVRDYLAWRRDLHSLGARWRSLAAEVGAPALEPEASNTFHGLERVAKSVDVAIVTATLAKRNLVTVGPKLSMPDGEITAMIGDVKRLTALSAAVRSAASRVADQRFELTRLDGLFPGGGAVASQARADVLSQIGRDDVDPREIEKRWMSVRAGMQSLRDRRDDFELIDEVCRTMTEAGAGAFARRLRTEPAQREAGDSVLVADWVMAWNWAVLMGQTESLGQHERLSDLSDQRLVLETRLRELFEQVVGARMRLGFAQNTSGTVRQALTVFMITLRKMAATCSGPSACRLRLVAREALESCHEGIPCQIMPAWRVAEQLPARLGAFDLVVIDDASQSDLRELTAMLRGRKVLVTDEDRPQAAMMDRGDRNIERIEHDLLRGVPAAIRQFLLPGASLCDLVKVLFPDRMIRLRDHVRRVDPAALPATALPSPAAEPRASGFGEQSPSWAIAGTADGRLSPQQGSTARVAFALEDEIATVAESLSLARRSRGDHAAEPSGVIEGSPPEWLSWSGNVRGPEIRAPRWRVRDGATADGRADAAASPELVGPIPPPWLDPVVMAAGAETEPRKAGDRATSGAQAPLDDPAIAAVVSVLTEKAAPSEKADPRPDAPLRPELASIDPPPLSARRWTPVEEPPKRQTRPLRRRMMAVAATVAIIVIASPIYWQPAMSHLPTSWQQVLNRIPFSWSAAAPASALPGETAPRKITADRVTQDGKEASASDDGSAAAAGGGTGQTVVSHAVLYQEDPVDPHGKRYTGTVTWHLDPGNGSGPNASLIKGDVEIDKQLNATLSLRRNSDTEMPASHIMELKFNWPDDSTHSGVDTLKGVTMKAVESARGAALSALTAKVTPKFFMIALSATDVDMKRNVLLLKGKEWFDIPIVYAGGSRAVLAIEKGADGERAFKDAFAAWGQ